jgi:hypothetical protein
MIENDERNEDSDYDVMSFRVKVPGGMKTVTLKADRARRKQLDKDRQSLWR